MIKLGSVLARKGYKPPPKAVPVDPASWDAFRDDPEVMARLRKYWRPSHGPLTGEMIGRDPILYTYQSNGHEVAMALDENGYEYTAGILKGEKTVEGVVYKNYCAGEARLKVTKTENGAAPYFHPDKMIIERDGTWRKEQ